jgi:hypothetical protein
VVKLNDEQDVETLRQISLLLDRENQRLITKNLQLTAELARLRGVSDVAQLTFTVQHDLQQARTQIFARPGGDAAAPPGTIRRPQVGHGPREHPTLPIVEIRHELPADQRQCPACGGELTEMAGQGETSDRVTTVKVTYQVEHHVRQKYRWACNGAVVTAPGPVPLIPAAATPQSLPWAWPSRSSRSPPARAASADDGARGLTRRLANAVGSDSSAGAARRTDLRGTREGGPRSTRHGGFDSTLVHHLSNKATL